MSELFSKLGIDWKLLLAQAVNFGILVFVLTKLLYKPILRLVEERQNKINQGLAMAKEAAEARRQFDVWKEEELSKLKKQADQLLKESENKGRILLQEFREKADEQAKRILEQAQKEAERSKSLLLKEAQDQLADLVLKTAEQVLEREVTKEDTKQLAKKILRQYEKG